MKIFWNLQQQSEEWFELKKGKMSASHGQEIGNCGKGLDTYVETIVRNLCAEDQHFTNKHTNRGNELEPIARLTYEFEKETIVKECGFIQYNDFVGCSPDGLIDEDPEGPGGLELKARDNKEHFRLLRTGKVDTKTIWQMNMSMLISGRKWWDFGTYNPNFKKDLWIKRFYLDPVMQTKLLQGFSKGEIMIKALLQEESVKFELQ